MDDQRLAGEFLERLRDLDFDGLAELLDPEIRMRALVPDGPSEYRGPEEVRQRLQWWFGSGEQADIVRAESRPVDGRFELAYGFRILEALDGGKPGWHTIEQRAFCRARERIVEIDLVCTGFVPVFDAMGETHRFDAGEMGCADGLVTEFKSWLRSVEIGDVVQVVARDPAAKEDLPSLARLMGNKVQSVETLDDGRLLISVERGK